MRMRAVSFIFVLLLILALALAGGSILISRLFFLSAMVILLSYLWTSLSIRGIEAQVKKLPENSQVGKSIDEETTIFNRSKLPKLLLEVQESADLPGHRNIKAINLSSGSSHSWRAKVYCRRRGQYHLGELTATATDPFGLFRAQRKLTEPQDILIYPATLDLPYWPLSHRDPGYGAGHWLQDEISPNAARVREYTTQDSLSRIHWRSTARMGKLMVKVFDPDRSRSASKNVWIFADLHQAPQLGEDEETTEEYCVTIAASLIKKYTDNQIPAGLVAQGDQPHLFLPDTGNEHLLRVLGALALVKATGDVPIEQVISRETKRLGMNSTMIVITPSASERLMVTLRQAASRGIITVAILLEPTSFGGTVSVANAATTLTTSGTRTYVVRQGDELVTALGSRAFLPHMRSAVSVA